MKNSAYINIDFFCVGAAKSGTTALHYFLLRHPEIYMPLKKEIHHFANDILKEDDYWLDSDAYYKLFKPAKQNQIIGETSVFYLLSDESADNIIKHNPNAKIIIMLRNPVEVIYSLHSQLVFNGEEDISDFKKAIETEPERKKGRMLPVNTRIIKKHLYTEVVRFSEQVERFIKIFPEKNIKIILFEDFKQNTLKIVQETYDFLQIDKSYKPKLKIHNANKKIKCRKLQKATTILTNKFLSKFIKEDNLERFRNFVININSIEEKRKPLDFDTKQYLINKLKPEILKLEKLLKRDLKDWYEQKTS